MNLAELDKKMMKHATRTWIVPIKDKASYDMKCSRFEKADKGMCCHRPVKPIGKAYDTNAAW